MVASVIIGLFGLLNWFGGPFGLLLVIFWLWMLVDAIRQREWVWVLILFVFPGLSAILYYFLVYRSAPSSMRGFELPGAQDRRRIKEL